MRSRLFSILILLLSINPDVAAQEDWKLEKEENGIKVFTKKVSDSDFKAFKAEMTVNCGIDHIIEVLKNVENYEEWAADSKEVKLLKMNGNDQYHYIETSLPWPFENRDMVYHFQYNRTNSNLMNVTVTGLPEYIEPKDGIVRMKKIEGYWALTSVGTNSASITYQMHVEPGGSVPAWLANAMVVNSPFTTFTRLKKLLEN